MTITHFELQNFRNLKQLSLTPSPTLNIIYGKNGSGKTSLLEAIFYLGRARSFRTTHIQHLITQDQAHFVCFGKIKDQAGKQHNLGVRRSPQEQTIKIDSLHIQRTSDLARLLPLQIINNDVHHLIDGGPKIRRQFIDWGVFHSQPPFADIMKNYRHSLRQRNAALKQKWKQQDLVHWDKQLVQHAEQIDLLRRAYLERFTNAFMGLLQDSFNLPDVKLSYRCGWDKTKALSTALQDNWELDRQRGVTHSGPHKADLKLTTQGNQALREVVSRGQQKIIATLLVLAQILVFHERQDTSTNLVLLIDDLPAELDRDFSAYFMRKILEHNIQIFVSATEPTLLTIPKQTPYKMFHVEHGMLSESSNRD